MNEGPFRLTYALAGDAMRVSDDGPAADRHLDLLALFFTLAGMLAGLAALALFLLGLGAVVTAATADQTDVAAGFAAALFIGFAIILGAFGAICAATGTGLRRRRPWSRPAGLLLALVTVFVVPFGTALGIYAFWVLLRQRSRELLGVA
jgi:hypothetical protein